LILYLLLSLFLIDSAYHVFLQHFNDLENISRMYTMYTIRYTDTGQQK